MRTGLVRWTLIAMLAAGASLSQAQTGGEFDLSWSTIDCGGGLSEGGEYSLYGVIGQPDVSSVPLMGGSYYIMPGFLADGYFYYTCARLWDQFH